MRHRSRGLELAALRLFLWVCRRLPRPAALAVGRRLGDLAFDCVRIRRAVSLSNLRNAFPEKSEREIVGIARSSYRHFAQTAVDFGRMPLLAPHDIVRLGEIQGREHAEWVRDQGRGGILLTAHFGNWEWGGAALQALGFPTVALVAEQHNRRVGELMDQIRRGAGMEILSAEKDLRGIVHALRQKRFIAIVADQDAGRDGIFVEFLGRPASTAVGPVRLAHRFGVPILLGLVVRQPDGRYRLELQPPIVIPQGGAEDAVLRTHTELWSRKLEEYVRRYPDHWFWMHRRWKTRPSAA